MGPFPVVFFDLWIWGRYYPKYQGRLPLIGCVTQKRDCSFCCAAIYAYAPHQRLNWTKHNLLIVLSDELTSAFELTPKSRFLTTILYFRGYASTHVPDLYRGFSSP